MDRLWETRLPRVCEPGLKAAQDFVRLAGTLQSSSEDLTRAAAQQTTKKNSKVKDITLKCVYDPPHSNIGRIGPFLPGLFIGENRKPYTLFVHYKLISSPRLIVQSIKIYPPERGSIFFHNE